MSNNPTSSDIAAAAADVLYGHLRNIREQLRLDQAALTYTNAVVISEEDSHEAVLTSERAMKEFLYSRIEFSEKQSTLLQVAYDKICKFITD